MKIIGVIPARYASSRFPGKPLADICGKPMIWWVYQQAKKSEKLNEVFVATDDDRIKKICEELDVKVIMTRNDHPDHISRIHEVSHKITADLYVSINGDEPLIKAELIDLVIPEYITEGDFYFMGAMRVLTDPAETLDPSNIKLTVNHVNECVYMSRAAIPYPKGSLMFNYLKYVGIECFNKGALDFFVSTPMGLLERIEDIDHLRFIESRKSLHFTNINSESISVDTQKDLDKVRLIFKQMLNSGEIII